MVAKNKENLSYQVAAIYNGRSKTW